MKMRKVFIDVNVIVDFLDAKRPRHDEAVSLMEHLLRGGYEVCLSEDMLSTVYYIMKDKEQTLAFFTSIVFTKWNVYAFGKVVYDEAAEIALREKSDFEDLLQCLCAKHNSCQFIISNDHKFYDCGVEVMSAEQFLAARSKQ